MRNRYSLLTLITVSLVLVVVTWGGLKAVTYLIQKPPSALTELVTKMNPPPPLPSGELAPLVSPPGFIATIFARDIKGARVLTRDTHGTLLVSETSEGKIVALPDSNADGKADRTELVLDGLRQPHGILVLCAAISTVSSAEEACTLYVAETHQLMAYQYDPSTLEAKEGEMLTALPSGGGHFTRTLLLHPDQKQILISVGSSCNVCIEENPRRATVVSLDIATRKVTPFATGLRNTVFMAEDPLTREVWGTDNGRDVIGDDIPPDEVNILKEGEEYGWPYCYGDNVHDTDFDARNNIQNPCGDAIPSHIALQAHSAALGLAFVPTEGWPEEMHNDVLIAYHGSWNRSEPTGYKVVRFDLNEKREAEGGPVDFLTGFLTTTDADDSIGRPVAILAEDGGVAYISDDRAGAIYRVTYTGVVSSE